MWDLKQVTQKLSITEAPTGADGSPRPPGEAKGPRPVAVGGGGSAQGGRVAGRGRRGPGWGWAVREGLCGEATGKLRRKGDGAQTRKRRQDSPEEKPKHQGPGLPDAPAARASPSNAGWGFDPRPGS